MSIKQILFVFLCLGFGINLWEFDIFISSALALEGALFIIAALMLILTQQYKIPVTIGAIAATIGLYDSIFITGIADSIGYFIIEVIAAIVFYHNAMLIYKNQPLFPKNISDKLPQLPLKELITDYQFDKTKDSIFKALNIVSLIICILLVFLIFIYFISQFYMASFFGSEYLDMIYESIKIELGFESNLAMMLFWGFFFICLLLICVIFYYADSKPSVRIFACAIYASFITDTILTIFYGLSITDLFVIAYCGAALYYGIIVHSVQSKNEGVQA
ncbi:hypothetical protein [Shewanella pneumatophori]|uniref:Uncharacterized protein n=1 Tax=Shewanella pneumatophori TaxID=314092 RepID=A0A9X2CGW5_9GAMM|nr:hypothetical protein [Shewanella pneumatophori]MCL1137854.1 hypothetical protein [Shewanella pneumatophori]